MRRLGFSLLSSALLLLTSGPVFSQGWIEYRDPEQGFGVNFPGEPTVEETVWESEYGAMLPAYVYRADTSRGDYSMTVVDYREAERIQAERALDCPEGAETCSGSTASTGAGYWRVDMQGSMVYAASQFLKRDSEMTHFAWNFLDLVEGLQLQLTNPDQSRTFAGIYLHADRLYVLEATVPQGRRGMGLFQQSMQFLDEEGNRIRYERFYHNSAPAPARLPR
jgi:hypothetical protein